jgi:hypothetical protein
MKLKKTIFFFGTVNSLTTIAAINGDYCRRNIQNINMHFDGFILL